MEDRPDDRQGGRRRDRPRFAQIEIYDPRGSAPPLHVHHNEDETFYVVEGEVTVFVGDERIDLGAGDYCFAPRGVPHTYLVTSERARMLVTISPAGFEELFARVGVPSTATSAQPVEGVAPRRPMSPAARPVRRRGPRPAPHPVKGLTAMHNVIELPDIALTELAAWARRAEEKAREAEGRRGGGDFLGAVAPLTQFSEGLLAQPRRGAAGALAGPGRRRTWEEPIGAQAALAVAA